MDKQLIIGLDIGTTSVKAVLFDFGGKVVIEVEEANETYYPQLNWVEQDPDQIERACVKAVSALIQQCGEEKDLIIGIGISCAQHSIICVDEQFQPLSRALIWSDGRASRICEQLDGEIATEFYRRTGVPHHPMSPFLKLLWMKENDFSAYKQAAFFMSVKEYIIQKWFGTFVTDYSMAAGSGLMNARTLSWDKDALKLTRVTENQLPKIVPPTYILTGMKQGIMKEIGLSQELPVIIGAADGQLANLGIGAIAEGEVALTVGTSGAIRQFTNTYQVNERAETFSYVFSEGYHVIGGATNNGGIVLQWVKELLNDTQDFGSFITMAKNSGPGADGLIFLPYINGERAPLWNQKSVGNFYGMKITHKKAHLIRAVLEGITFNLYQIDQSLAKLTGKSDVIYVNGGLARSDIWLEMLANIFNKKVYVATTHNSSAWGAAWVALVALGVVDNYDQIKETIRLNDPILPNTKTHQDYQHIYQHYQQLSQDLSKYFV